jgi:hypothetical protein
VDSPARKDGELQSSLFRSTVHTSSKSEKSIAIGLIFPDVLLSVQLEGKQ